MDISEEVILWAIGLLSNTAHLVSISTDLISEQTYQEHSLNQLIDHFNLVRSYDENTTSATPHLTT